MANEPAPLPVQYSGPSTALPAATFTASIRGGAAEVRDGGAAVALAGGVGCGVDVGVGEPPAVGEAPGVGLAGSPAVGLGESGGVGVSTVETTGGPLGAAAAIGASARTPIRPAATAKPRRGTGTVHLQPSAGRE